LIGGRTVPLLAIFSAFTFAVMMFNVPVPGGTTAHAVGGTLTAIVLGPWAAVISTSVALIIQALFFGDGGITAIGINSLNMGVVLPLAGYVAYRAFAGRSSMLSQRRVIAAAIGAYVGISLAALAVGFELGIQPNLWTTNGVPDYSPYGLSTAIPAMLLSHMVGASFVEAVVTALGLAYLQRSYPEILLRRESRTAEVEAGGRRVNPWIPALGFTAAAATAVFVAGWIKGGSLGTWAGLDWSSVKGSDVVATVLVSGLVSAVVLPALFFALKSKGGWRTPIMIFAGILIWVPIGLIAPGGAFGEEASASPEEVASALQARQNGDPSLFEALPGVNRECSCVPNKINDVTYASKTLLAGYRPPWVSASAPAWKQNAGYQVAGLAGMAMLAAGVFGIYGAVRRFAPAAPPDWRTAEE
jgi:cobalamin biosynthesis protein CbiM